jgi:two-component system chemotaxis sensor kinase CheA
MPVDPRFLSLVPGFCLEATDLCAAVTRELLQLESAQETDDLRKHFEVAARGLHTLKGSSAVLGLLELSKLAHQLEEEIAPFYKNLQPLSQAAVDTLLNGLERFMDGVRAEGSVAAKPAEATNNTAQIKETTEQTTAEFALGGWRIEARQITDLMQEVERLREFRYRLDGHRQTLEGLLDKTSRHGNGALYETLSTLWRSVSIDSDEVGDLVSGLEEQLRSICTLPAKNILEPLVNAVRGLCRSTGKEARISFVGAEVSLDRRLLESLRGPLAHLVRNAVDHGIELPSEREARGKFRGGLITIRVEQQGNTILIEVSDDGAGLDPKMLKEAAVAQGAPAAELERQSPRQLHQLIFRDGLSTKSEVSESSGRGVGLSAVKAQIEALQGRIEVESTPNQGSRFFLWLPAGLGASLVLLVRSGEHVLGLPIVALEEALLSQKVNIIGGSQLEHHGELIPLVDLGVILGLRQKDLHQRSRPILILQAQGQKLALGIDELVGDRSLVISPLPEELRELPAYQGAATRSDGEPLLILRAEWLVRQRQEEVFKNSPKVLVVDDSLTARAMHRSILEAGGFTVQAVGSSTQAIEMLSRSKYDALVCDVLLQETDGIALVSWLRSQTPTSSLPIILVSSQDKELERARALSAGADRFLSKRECSQGRLLSELSGLIERGRERP